MSERKVLNKYYPPDFDPSKIPRMKLPKNRQYTVRLMAPFNMRCATCGEYIYRGKKFNARKEDVEGDDYCGIRIYRFYIKCTRCLQEISFKTDPRNTDYEIEAGATRNFMALKLAQEQEQRAEEELKEEEANNPMKLLESRTQQSKIEIEVMECLEEIKDLNRRHYNIDFNELLKKYHTDEMKEKIQQMQREKDEELAKQLISKKRSLIEEEEEEVEIIEEEEEEKEDEHNEIKNEIPITFEKKEKPKDKEITSSFDTNATAFSSHNSTLNKFKALAAKKQKSDTSSESSSSNSVTKPKSPEKPKTSALNLLCNYDDSNSDTGSNSD